MEATHLYCARCRAIQPVRFERLVASEKSLGNAAQCGYCGFVAFTLLHPVRVYCDVCDDIRPALFHEYAPAGKFAGGLVRCGICYTSCARLYGGEVSKSGSG